MYQDRVSRAFVAPPENETGGCEAAFSECDVQSVDTPKFTCALIPRPRGESRAYLNASGLRFILLYPASAEFFYFFFAKPLQDFLTEPVGRTPKKHCQTSKGKSTRIVLGLVAPGLHNLEFTAEAIAGRDADTPCF